ncbi:MAG: hypothetical protein PHY48_07665, partial [Candidatus Cloacimonetes bacterium]|nr:hypothetical protein [Candidatus Cloacimonadota bacterium]
MIEKMRKYSFVLYHLDYEAFLSDLQKLGVVHIIRNSEDKTPTQIQNQELIKDYLECTKFLTKLNSDSQKIANPLPTKALFNKISKAREEKEGLTRHLEQTRKQIRDLEPWGHFDYALMHKLREYGLSIDFHYCLKNHFNKEWEEQYPIQIINERNGILYFVVLTNDGSPALEADTFSFHHHTLQEFEKEYAAAEAKIADIETYLKDISHSAIEAFTVEIKQLSTSYDYEDATHQ